MGFSETCASLVPTAKSDELHAAAGAGHDVQYQTSILKVCLFLGVCVGGERDVNVLAEDVGKCII